MVRGLQLCGRHSGARHRKHHRRPRHRFHGRKHAAAKFVRDVPQQLRHVEHRADSDGRARYREKQQRHLEIAHLAEDDVGAAMDHVADADGAFVSAERNPFAEPMRECAASEQSDAGRGPQIADARGSAIEHQLAKKAEQDLRRAASRSPSHPDQCDPQDQRRCAHVAQAFGVFVPGPHHFVFGRAPFAARGSRRLPRASRDMHARKTETKAR